MHEARFRQNARDRSNVLAVKRRFVAVAGFPMLVCIQPIEGPEALAHIEWMDTPQLLVEAVRVKAEVGPGWSLRRTIGNNSPEFFAGSSSVHRNTFRECEKACFRRNGHGRMRIQNES